MSYNNLLQNSIFSNQTYKDFHALNNLTKEELRVFINLVTIHGNITDDYNNKEGGKLLEDNNFSDRKKLFLLNNDGYTDVDLIFSLNILIYLGDLYQKKTLEEFVYTSFEEINKERTEDGYNRLSWLLKQGFRTEILNTNGDPIELNWGVNNFNTLRSNVIDNPNTSEINYEEYISALDLIFQKLEQDRNEDSDTNFDLLDFINYASTTLQVDEIIDILDTETRSIKFKITRQTLESGAVITKPISVQLIGESFIGYRQLDKPIQRKKKIKEGFTSINSYIKPINSNENSKKYNINSENILRFYEKIPDTLSINKIGKNVVKQTISIDSRHRNNYYETLSTSYSINLPERQKDVLEMSIVAVEMPMTFYSISEYLGNNTMLVIADSSLNSASVPINSVSYVNSSNNIIDFEPVSIAWRVKLEDGNYDTKSWLTDKLMIERSMNRSLTLAIPGAINKDGKFAAFETPLEKDWLNSDFNGTKDIRYTINKINGKSVFSTPLPTEFNRNTSYEYNTKNITKIRFCVDTHGNLDTNTDIHKRMGWAIGYRAAEYVVGASELSKSRFSAVSEGVGFISSLRYGFLSIEDYQNNAHPSLMVAFNDYIIDKKIMTRLCLAPLRLGHDLSSRETGFISHRRTPRNYFKPVDIDKLTIKLFDEYGRIIDLNNMDWSLTVEFSKLY
ncbi:MAG: hypothetical protein CMD14_02990 [Flavobacteriales bacterium]|mgnify:CR=1 FL=1|nr:hypothetical protein [Flavobacteriales bacterium]|tara:strand:+ start:5593 stop:7620 length:2028 start_codon:yes stop_codon:yes gene_type:complete